MTPRRKKIVRPALKYFGGKTRAVDIIRRHFPPRLTEMVSPFIGGGSIEIEMAKRRVRVHAYDAEPALACFWKYQLAEREALFADVKRRGQVHPHEWLAVQARLSTMVDSVERAALYYLINRSAFKGGTLSAGRSKTRWATRALMHDIRHFRAPKLSVECADFQVSLARHPDLFAYLDPPYLVQNQSTATCYGQNGELHQNFDHQGLFDLVKDRPRWIMSQSNSEKARALYAGFKLIEPKWAYGGDQECKELLIFSRDLEPRQPAA
jgi:DNA adenine methylase